LTELPKKLKRAVNIQVAVKEVDNKIIFLRKIMEGCCDSSYGIQVAGMAGIPSQIIERAWEILEILESDRIVPDHKKSGRPLRVKKSNMLQGDLFTPQSNINPDHKKLHDDILHLNLNNMTPLELLNKIHELQQKYEKSP
jgi:DNA mismatch repair protein MutS